MYNFNLPKWDKKIGYRTLSIITTVLFVLSIIPLLAIGHFNWMSADDLSLSYKPRLYYENTGNVIGAFAAGFIYSFEEYFDWMGCYFSSLMFKINPCIIDERLYFLTGYLLVGILVFGVWYFFNALIVHGFKGDKHLSNVLSLITLTMMIHSLQENGPRVEAFYWYTGATHYTFMIGMGLFWLGLMIRVVFAQKKAERIRKLVWACFWGLWCGGANFLTALSLAICSFLVIVLIVLEKIGYVKLEDVDEEQRKAFRLLLIPVVINLIGFVLNVTAPGNSVRDSITNGFGPVKAVMIALYYVFSICINELTRWEVLILLGIFMVVSWNLAGTIKHRFEHPLIFSVFAFGMSAANVVPPLFATGNIGAGRLMATFWIQFVLMLALAVFYVMAWARQTLESEVYLVKDKGDEKAFSRIGTFAIVICALFLAFGSAMSVKVNPYYFTWSSAVYDIANGSAKTFYEENLERLEILKDESVTDAVLKPYSVRPEMLAFDDITKDKDDWINRAFARYYHKNSVVLQDNE